jgi:hypothetical protein
LTEFPTHAERKTESPITAEDQLPRSIEVFDKMIFQYVLENAARAADSDVLTRNRTPLDH